MTTQTKTVTIKRTFNASPERVFDAWIDPAIAPRFLFAKPPAEIIRCDIDARPGGKYVITRRDENGETEHVGEYEVVDRPRRLVFTFGVPRIAQQVSRVVIDITPTANGCELTLTNEDVLSEWADKTKEGWKMILGNLQAAVQ